MPDREALPRQSRTRARRRVELIYGTCGCMMPCSCVEFDGKRYRSVVEIVGALDTRLAEAVETSDAERQAVLDVVNIYGDETLHKALDNIGWPANYTRGGQ